MQSKITDMPKQAKESNDGNKKRHDIKDRTSYMSWIGVIFMSMWLSSARKSLSTSMHACSVAMSSTLTCSSLVVESMNPYRSIMRPFACKGKTRCSLYTSDAADELTLVVLRSYHVLTM